MIANNNAGDKKAVKQEMDLLLKNINLLYISVCLASARLLRRRKQAVIIF